MAQVATPGIEPGVASSVGLRSTVGSVLCRADDRGGVRHKEAPDVMTEALLALVSSA